MQNKKQSRRKFIQQTASAICLPTLVPSSVFGRGKRVSPSDRINLGFIGLGGQGTNQLIGIRWAPKGGFMGRDDTHVVAVCEVNRKRLKKAQQSVFKKQGNKDCAAYSRFEDLLARQNIDAVVIATGDRWHALLSIAAAKAGKDIYCEKPHTLTIGETKLVADTTKRYGTIMQVGTQQRSWHEFRFTCELVRNGYIGDIKTVRVNVGGLPSFYSNAPEEAVPDWLDWERWLGPTPHRPYSSKIAPGGWMGYRDYSGGEMTNWGAHMYDIAQWGLGMDGSGPVEIIPPNGKDVPLLTFIYANGSQLVYDKISTGIPGVRFEGTKGSIEVTRDYMITNPASLRRQRIGDNEIHLHKASNHQTDFLEAVRSRRRPSSDAEIARRSLTVCHLGNIARWVNRPLKWDPVNEKFVNNEQANRMLFRDAQSPWRY
jgi:predicted dehydrogenase